MKYSQLLILIITVIFTSCKKERFIGPEIIDEAISEEVNTAYHYYSHIYHIVSSEAELLGVDGGADFLPDSLLESAVDPCANLIYHMSDDETYVKDLIIYYADTNCFSSSLKKYGTLKVHITGPIEEVGTELIIIPEDFYLDNNRIEGTIKINNKGFTPTFKFEFSQEVIDGKIWLNGFQYFTWNSQSTVLVDFFTSQMIYESVSTGLSRAGRTYSSKSLYPSKRAFDCRYFQVGELKLTAEWGLDQNVNYGNGDCDNKAELWQNGSVKPIELP